MTNIENDRVFVADLEDRLLPYFEGPDGDVLGREVAFAHVISSKAHVARLRLSQVQAPVADPLATGAHPALDGRLLRRKATLGPRLDRIIARAQARVRSVS